MGYNEPDLYHSPEKYGLEVVGSIEWSEPDWSFDMTVVWKGGVGEYYFASDSGCSCPSPFEDFTSVDMLEGPFTKNSLEYRLMEIVDSVSKGGYGYGYANLKGQVDEILSRL